MRSITHRPYVLALLAIAGAALARFALDPVLHDKSPLLLFACGIVVAALYGGFRAGTAATVLSIVAADYLFIHPRYTFFLYDTRADSITLLAFLILGVGISGVIEAFRRTRTRLYETGLKLRDSELQLAMVAATVPEPLFTTTSAGVCDYVSDNFCQYSGLTPAQACVRWTELIHPEDRPAALEQWIGAVRAASSFDATYRIRRADGEYRWFKVHAKPVVAPDGRVTKWTGVCVDIHEHRLLEQALARRTEELAESSQEFQRFAFRVAHDLKEPLRMIGIYSDLFVQRNESPADRDSRMYVNYILDGVARVESQLHDLLEYAKAGTLEIPSEPVDFNSAVDSSVANLSARIRETGALVTHDSLPTLVANRDRIVSVFQNLIGNALKYRGADPPRIHVSVRAEADQWIFSVKDNGTGFEIQDQERIFKPFERASNIPGSGLGLAIVKRIIEMDGGSIWAESSVGQGSTFYFSLPKSIGKMGAAQAPASATRSRAQAS